MEILDIIRSRVGEEKAIKDTEIRQMIDVPDPDKRKPTAGLRDIINSLRQKAYPICSGIKGYWYAKDIAELRENIEALDGRAIKIMTATKGMKETLEAWTRNNQATLL
jgi:hypothetical protein